MQITIRREQLLKPLGHVTRVVERRQTLPILSHVRLRVEEEGVLELTGTDLEIELVAMAEAQVGESGAMTVPARKLFDICRALPAEAVLEIAQQGERAVLRSGKSRFALGTLPAADFPVVDVGGWDLEIEIGQGMLKRLVDRTHFCMAHQDVRYYLNGMLLEVVGKRIRAVATDGHRMGLAEGQLEKAVQGERQAIVPRKGVLELGGFLEPGGADARLRLGSNHVQVEAQGLRLTSKLIDGRFPDYQQVLPSSYRRRVRAERGALREALARVAILANEKYRGVRFAIRPGALLVSAHNPEQEEAQEELPAQYEGDEIEVGFNVTYLTDALGALPGEEVEIGINDPNSSCSIQAPGVADTRYVVMPMRL